MSENLKRDEKNPSETHQISKENGGLVHNHQNYNNSSKGAVMWLIFGFLILVLLSGAIMGVWGIKDYVGYQTPKKIDAHADLHH
jgi:hypothetical protein